MMTNKPPLIVPEERKRYEVTLTLHVDAPHDMGTGEVLLDITTGLMFSHGIKLERLKEINIEFINEYRK